MQEMTLDDGHQHDRVDHRPTVAKVGYVLRELGSHVPSTGRECRRDPDRRSDRTAIRGDRQNKPGKHVSQVQRVALAKPRQLPEHREDMVPGSDLPQRDGRLVSDHQFIDKPPSAS
jgi:hypothetical protein